jgi:glutaredoxin-like protein
MIPLKDQEAIRQKFSQELAGQVKIDFFTEREVNLEVPGKKPCVTCKPVRELLTELAGLGGGLLSLRTHYFEDNPPEKATFSVERIPAIVLRGPTNRPVKFYGIPGGTEFPAFLECLIDISRGEVLLSPDAVQSLAELANEVSVKVFVTPTCQYCPGMMRLAYQLALASANVHAETIEVNEFPELADRYKVQAVPLTVLNDSIAIPGLVQEQQIIEAVVKAAAEAKPATPDRIERGKERGSGLYIP